MVAEIETERSFPALISNIHSSSVLGIFFQFIETEHSKTQTLLCDSFVDSQSHTTKENGGESEVKMWEPQRGRRLEAVDVTKSNQQSSELG